MRWHANNPAVSVCHSFVATSMPPLGPLQHTVATDWLKCIYIILGNTEYMKCGLLRSMFLRHGCVRVDLSATKTRGVMWFSLCRKRRATTWFKLLSQGGTGTMLVPATRPVSNTTPLRERLHETAYSTRTLRKGSGYAIHSIPTPARSITQIASVD